MRGRKLKHRYNKVWVNKFDNKIVENKELENFGSDSDRRLEEARLVWEKEKEELLEKQRQLQKQNEELLQRVDDFKGR